MKLSRADTVNLNTILATVALGGIDSIVIADGLASGLNNKQATFISTVDVPTLPQKIGLSRIKNLRQRLDLLLNNTDVYVDAKESDRGEISMLEIISGKTKIQFRCTSTALIKAPKEVADPPIAIISLKKKELQLVLDSLKVLSAEMLVMTLKDDGKVVFSAADATNDRMTIELDTPMEHLGAAEDFETTVHHYSTDILSTLLRTAMTDDGISFSVAEEGTINLLVNGHPMYVFCQIEGDD